MRTIATLTLACAVMVPFNATPTELDDAVRTLGVDAIKTLQFSASGATFTVGQNFTPNDPWPRVKVTSYTALIDYVAVEESFWRKRRSSRNCAMS